MAFGSRLVVGGDGARTECVSNGALASSGSTRGVCWTMSVHRRLVNKRGCLQAAMLDENTIYLPITTYLGWMLLPARILPCRRIHSIPFSWIHPPSSGPSGPLDLRQTPPRHREIKWVHM